MTLMTFGVSSISEVLGPTYRPKRTARVVLRSADGSTDSVTSSNGFFNRIKNYRGIATRYDRKAINFLAAIKLVAVRMWLKSYESTP